MLRIEKITLREIRLPLREPFRISSGVVAERRIALLELTDADGVTAWSECVAGEYPNYSPETIDTAWLAITEWIAPRVLGRAFRDPRAVFPVLDRDLRGHLMAKAAVEMGVWVLAAERLGASLANLLGGTRSHIATGISMGIQESPDRLVEKAREALALGYRKLKIKITPGADVDYVRAVRAALGPTAPLMVDANNAYTLADADHLARLDALDLMMIEQPLAFDDIVQHAALQRRLATPVCLDESITSVDRARDMVTLGSGRIVNIKPGRVGGFAASLAIHDFCETKGIPVWCGGMLESGVGRACNVALASLRNFTKPGDVSPSARYWQRDIVTPEWTMSADGLVRVPLDAPGLGVTVDRGYVDDLTTRTQVLVASQRPVEAPA
ncbi:MAG TPA: o-succinylbenzoate synthase [Gemmatimonadaceae bacterium]|nr:o-succinylbenzoate synthase [Gemmatimonadaceae bacterium]